MADMDGEGTVMGSTTSRPDNKTPVYWRLYLESIHERPDEDLSIIMYSGSRARSRKAWAALTPRQMAKFSDDVSDNRPGWQE